MNTSNELQREKQGGVNQAASCGFYMLIWISIGGCYQMGRVFRKSGVMEGPSCSHDFGVLKLWGVSFRKGNIPHRGQEWHYRAG